jgi:hypothetical protein
MPPRECRSIRQLLQTMRMTQGPRHKSINDMNSQDHLQTIGRTTRDTLGAWGPKPVLGANPVDCHG